MDGDEDVRAPGPNMSDLRTLVDRAAISDLLIDFARCLDVRDWDGYVANFAHDGVLVLPSGTFAGREEIAARATHGLDHFDATHHVSTNHIVAVDGDQASSRSSLLVAHIPDAAEPGRDGDAGGWYDCIDRRESDGWRFTRVELSVAFTTGTDLPGA